jgi:PmbA protein
VTRSLVPADSPFSIDDARRVSEAALAHRGADDVEVLVTGSRVALTRYAGSQIIQNTQQSSVRAYVRVVAEGRAASASTNQIDVDHLLRAAGNALESARAAPPDPLWPGLPDPGEVGRAQGAWRWDAPTATATPAARGDAVSTIVGLAGGVGTAGVFETSSHCFAIFSSRGVDCVDGYTRCVVSCLADTGETTGWAEASSHAIGEVDVESVTRRSLDKAAAGPPRSELPSGDYEVVLEAPAVAALLEYLAYTGFGAKQVIEGESFLSTRAGTPVAAPEVTIADDVWHPSSVGIGFDLEGVPKKKVAVIAGGTATGPVTDLRTARQLGVEPSGHASGSNEFGPYAANLVMAPGDLTEEALVAGVDDGLLITRLHYVNILDRPATLLTGMTRDGTFRISKGEIAENVTNFRFAQSALDALAAVSGAGRDLESFAPEFGSFGSTIVPALRVGRFHFSSKTSH